MTSTFLSYLLVIISDFATLVLSNSQLLSQKSFFLWLVFTESFSTSETKPYGPGLSIKSSNFSSNSHISISQTLSIIMPSSPWFCLPPQRFTSSVLSLCFCPCCHPLPMSFHWSCVPKSNPINQCLLFHFQVWLQSGWTWNLGTPIMKQNKDSFLLGIVQLQKCNTILLSTGSCYE